MHISICRRVLQSQQQSKHVEGRPLEMECRVRYGWGTIEEFMEEFVE